MKFISEIYKGNLDVRNYLVDITSNSNKLIEKDNIIRLNDSNQLIQLKKSDDNTHWDISVRIYEKNKKLIISLHPITVIDLTRLSSDSEDIIMSKKDIYFIIKLYYNKENDKPIKEIKIPFNQLLDKRNISIDISDIFEVFDIHDLIIYVNKIFNSIEYKIISDSIYIEFNDSLNSGFNLVKKNSGINHILLKYHDKQLTVFNNIGDDLMEIMFDGYMKFWVVDNNPNQLIEVLNIDVKKLIIDKISTVNTKNDLSKNNLNMIHKYSQLVIEKEI